jgi:ferritin-like metal-binding protein YciE
MQKAATSEELKNAFETHTQQSQEHVARLEQAFELLAEKAQAKKCDAIAGIIEEGKGIIEETEKELQQEMSVLYYLPKKVEHYEIFYLWRFSPTSNHIRLNRRCRYFSANFGRRKRNR